MDEIGKYYESNEIEQDILFMTVRRVITSSCLPFINGVLNDAKT
jgi:hypothetical protein